MNNTIKIFYSENAPFVFFRDYLSVYPIDKDLAQKYEKKIISEEDIVDRYFEANKNLEPFTKANFPAKTSNLCLILTRKCTLRCHYCYAIDQSGDDSEDMTFEIAKKAINVMLETNPDANGYGIVFFGGEPLLKIDLIRQIIGFCEKEITKKRKKFVGYSMTTNGTIINQSVLDLLKNNNIGLQISIDGIKENHDKNRIYPSGAGSYDIIMEKIKLLKQNEIPFVIHSTFDPHIDLYDTICFLEGLQIPFGYGFTIDAIDTDKEVTNYGNANWVKIQESYDKLYHFYIDKIHNGGKIYCNNLLSCVSKIKNRIAKEYSCISGKSTLSIMPNGTIIPCQNFQRAPYFFQGNVLEIDHFQTCHYSCHVNTHSICNNCWMKYLCGGGCYYEKYMINGNLVTPPKPKCKLFKIQTEFFLKLYVFIETHNYIDQFCKSISNELIKNA